MIKNDVSFVYSALNKKYWCLLKNYAKDQATINKEGYFFHRNSGSNIFFENEFLYNYEKENSKLKALKAERGCLPNWGEKIE